jgi:alpha/beta superfamily hydrolase
MLANALSISVLVTASFVMLYQKLPRNLRRYIVKYSLVTDFLAMVVTYYMFGGTVTALLAGAIVDLMISVILHIANHPQDFEWLFDALKSVQVLIDKAKEYIKQINNQYKAQKVPPQILNAEVSA